MKHLSDANKNKLLALLRSRAAAGEASLKSWGRDQRPQIPGILAEEIADALVSEGKATREVRSHGGRVWRAVLEAPPAPTPEPDVEGVAEEEPVAVAGAAEPCQRCAELNATVATWERQWGSHGIERMVLQSEIASLRQERDEARHSLATSAAEYDRLFKHLCRRLAIEETVSVDYIVGAVGLLVDGADARRRTPALDPGAIAHYLLELPADRWQALATARQQLAEGRTLAERGARLQEEALAAVDRLLDAPAGDAPAEPAPPSGEQPAAGGTMIDRTLEFFQAHPTEGFRAQQLAEALGGDRQSWTVPLSQLTTRGEVERVERGVYRLARKARRAA